MTLLHDPVQTTYLGGTGYGSIDNEFVSFVAFYKTKKARKSHVRLSLLPPSKHPSTARCHQLTVKPARQPHLLHSNRKPPQTIHHVFEEICQTFSQDRGIQFYGLFLHLNPSVDDRRHLLLLIHCARSSRRSHFHSPDFGNWKRFERVFVSTE